MVKRLTLVILSIILVLPLLITGCSSPAPATTSAPIATTSSPIATTSAPSAAATSTTAAAAYTVTKPVTIIVTMGPGSSYDMYARGVAPYLSKALGVDVTVKNITGAAGLNGMLELWRGKTDGTAIGLVDMEGMVAFQMVNNTASTSYDMKKLEWLSIPATGYFMLGVDAKSQIKSVKDLIAAGKVKPIREFVAEVGTTEIIFNAVTGINSTFVINSEASGSASIMAMLKGEAETHIVTESLYAPFVKSGDIRPILYLSDKKSTMMASLGYPDMQNAVEAGYPELAFLSAPRGFALPPGTPQNVISAFETAFTKAYADQALIDWGVKANAPLQPKNRKETITALNGLFDLYQKYTDLLKQYLKF